jgi:hypothetical protein
MHFTISRPQKKRKAQPGGEAASSPACAIGAFIGLHGQKRIKNNSDFFVLLILLVNDSEYSKSAGAKPVLSPGCIYLVSLAREELAPRQSLVP